MNTAYGDAPIRRFNADKEADWRVGLARMERMGVTLTSVEMAIYELLERAEGEEFRKILPLVKG